jgi:penicillin-binding protein 1B
VSATPSIALGSYGASPLEMSGAYTVFSNAGTRVSPMMLKSIRDAHAAVLNDFHNDSKAVLDPRVAYVMTTMMESVIDNGTGSTVRARGFTAPAAGKTGTSHDAWFAGYTSNLLCVVWVGNDDYTDIKLAGGSTAAPIWAEFMKRAQKISRYADMKGFSAPQGVVDVQIDKVTNRLATPACPQTYYVAFIAGTEPQQTCEQSFADHRGVFSTILGLGSPEAAPPPTTNGPLPTSAGAAAKPPETAAQPTSEPPAEQKKKKGFFSKVFGGKGGDKNQKDTGANSSPDKGNQPPPK